MSVTTRASRGFTLIELLTVIGIVVVLMALLFPAFNIAIKKAKITKARAEVKQIAAAWTGYLNDYRGWLGIAAPGGITEMSLTEVKILQGTASGGPNPRNIVYMEFSGTATNSSGFVDPWKRTYKVTLDANLINAADTVVHGVISRNVAVWSEGPETTDPKDDIKSWE